MKKQMQAMGLAIDWSREMCACDPKYYKWNQWLFLKMLEKGIAYRKTPVLLKPQSDKAAQVIVHGTMPRTLGAEYYRCRKGDLLDAVLASSPRLRAAAAVVIVA